MRKLANSISAYIYILILKKFTNQSKEEILGGETIDKFGANLVFSSLIFMMLIILSFYLLIWGFQGIVSLNQQ